MTPEHGERSFRFRIYVNEPNSTQLENVRKILEGMIPIASKRWPYWDSPDGQFSSSKDAVDQLGIVARQLSDILR